MKKIRNTKGETLIEVLTATLIVSLSSVVFLTMVMTSVNINRKTTEIGERFYQAMSKVEVYQDDVQKETASPEKPYKVQCEIIDNAKTSEAKKTFPIEVDVYESEGLYSYK